RKVPGAPADVCLNIFSDGTTVPCPTRPAATRSAHALVWLTVDCPAGGRSGVPPQGQTPRLFLWGDGSGSPAPGGPRNRVGHHSAPFREGGTEVLAGNLLDTDLEPRIGLHAPNSSLACRAKTQIDRGSA